MFFFIYLLYFYQFLCFFALTARYSALKEEAKYRAISAMRADCRTPKGQRLSQ